MLAVVGLTKRYPTFALTDVSFEIPAGSWQRSTEAGVPRPVRRRGAETGPTRAARRHRLRAWAVGPEARGPLRPASGDPVADRALG